MKNDMKSHSEIFIAPKLSGIRFADNSIPSEYLRDLTALGDLLLELSKDVFKQRNPGRKRAPKRLTKSYELHLASISAGSAVANFTVKSLDLLPTSQEYLEEAKERFGQILLAAQDNPDDLLKWPEGILKHFKKLGASIKHDESLTFVNAAGVLCSLTPKIRQRILNVVEGTSVEQEFEVTGLISEVNRKKRTFTLELSPNRTVTSIYHVSLESDILSCLNGYREKRRAMFTGIGRFLNESTLINVTSLSSVTILDPLDVYYRFSELAELKDGWFDGSGKGYSKQLLDYLARNIHEILAPAFRPHVYPLPTNNVRLEWTIGSWDASASIDMKSLRGFLHALNFDSNSERSANIELGQDANWLQLLEWLQGLEAAR